MATSGGRAAKSSKASRSPCVSMCSCGISCFIGVMTSGVVALGTTWVGGTCLAVGVFFDAVPKDAVLAALFFGGVFALFRAGNGLGLGKDTALAVFFAATDTAALAVFLTVFAAGLGTGLLAGVATTLRLTGAGAFTAFTVFTAFALFAGAAPIFLAGDFSTGLAATFAEGFTTAFAAGFWAAFGAGFTADFFGACRVVFFCAGMCGRSAEGTFGWDADRSGRVFDREARARELNLGRGGFLAGNLLSQGVKTLARHGLL